jgi:hypothetical protein
MPARRARLRAVAALTLTLPPMRHPPTVTVRLVAPLLAIFAVVGCASDGAQPESVSGGRSIALDTAWLLPGHEANLGDVTQVLALKTGDVLVADAGAGNVLRYDRTGRLLGNLVTRGSGPRQAVPPYWMIVDADTLFLTPTGPSSREVVWVALGDATSGRHVRQIRGATPLACAANGRCLVRRGAAWSTELPLSRPGETVRDSIVLGWATARGLGSDNNFGWFARLDGPLLVAFDWPGGPVPIGIAAHEFVPGALLAFSGEYVWSYSDESRLLRTWRFGSSASTEHEISAPQQRLARRELDDSTERRVDLAKSEMLKIRTRAVRNLSHIESKRLPLGAAIVPGSSGRAWIEVFADGDRAMRRYLPAQHADSTVNTIVVPSDVTLLFLGDSLAFGTVRTDTSGTGLIALRLRNPH